MKYQDIENEFDSNAMDGDFGSGINVFEMKQFFKTKMKEAMMEIIGEDDPGWRKALQHSGIMWTSGRNELRAEQRQRVNEFFEEEEIAH